MFTGKISKGLVKVIKAISLAIKVRRVLISIIRFLGAAESYELSISQNLNFHSHYTFANNKHGN